MIPPPPSTVIRSRFRSIGERLPPEDDAPARAAKRFLSDDADADAGESPFRRALFAVPPFDASATLALEAQVAEQARRIGALERDRRWLAAEEERRAAERRADADRELKRADAALADADAWAQKVMRLEAAADDAARRMRAMQAAHRAEVDALHAGLLAHATDHAPPSLKDLEPPSQQDHKPPSQQDHKPQSQQDLGPPTLKDDDRVARLERHIRDQCAHIRTVEQANRALRSDVQRLAADAAAAQRERERADALALKAQRLEDAAQRAELAEDACAAWRRAFGPDATPAAVAHAADALQRRVADAEARAALAAAAQTAADDARAASALAAQTARDARASLADAQADALAARAAQARAEREAEFLRAALHAYDAEEAARMPDYSRAAALRITQLERLVDAQRAWLSPASGPADAQAAADAARDLEAARVADAVRDAEAARDAECARADAAERDAARLELLLAAGAAHNPRTTRVLQLTDNPAARDFAIRSERLAALAAENAALVERLRTLNVPADRSDQPDQPDQSHPLFHSIDNLRSENARLEAQLRDTATLLSRYKSELRHKFAKIRDVIYTVLGFRVDFLRSDAGGVRFTSTYAKDVDRSFIFVPDAKLGYATMHLTGGGSKPYIQALANDIRFWIQERGSIPGFMATVTLQSFDEKSQP
ncbi:coiled-coil domain-containing protein mad1 [Coemansia thaxteri]|uniref:Spindle assembly checkpoint component MAD1 n=1 Tax=Coemansia thaxteri TaxID=2663907 RepID=A0A9W8BBI3_9FUNG|nr:coiled-coil domain-containing protein mad1 [Coemansia thaxteri]